MVQNLVAVFSLLIGAAGLMLSYAGHRQRVRQDAQERALRAEEQLRADHAREERRQREKQLSEERRQREEQLRQRYHQLRQRQEREARAQRERDRYQASMIHGRIRLFPSRLDDSWAVPQVVIYNGSNQPVRDVRVFLRGEVTNEWHLVGTGRQFFELPPMQTPAEIDGPLSRVDPDVAGLALGRVTVEFTDVAGVRWRREGEGALRRAREGADGQEIWGEPEPPIVERVVERPGADSREMDRLRGELRQRLAAPAPAKPAPAPAQLEQREAAAMPAPPSQRRVGLLRPVIVLVSVVLIAGGIWWLLH